MKVLGFSVVLILASASMVNGYMWSHNCTYCPPCVTEMTPEYVYPVDDPCKYCLCDNGTPELKECDDNQEFDPDLNRCVPSERCRRCCDDCCKNDCPCCYEGIDYPIKNPNKCKYCLCAKDGGIYTEWCPWGMRFNDDTHACDIPDPDCCFGHVECCGVTCPGDDVEHHYANEKDPTGCTFCCCLPHNTTVLVRRCPFGEHFVGGTCVSTSEPCHGTKLAVGEELIAEDSCGHIVCPADFRKAPLYPCPSDTGSYCKCQSDGRPAQTQCKQGKVFSEKMQTCQ